MSLLIHMKAKRLVFYLLRRLTEHAVMSVSLVGFELENLDKHFVQPEADSCQ